MGGGEISLACSCKETNLIYAAAAWKVTFYFLEYNCQNPPILIAFAAKY